MKVRIFNCHHVVPQRCVLTDMFATLVSGQYGNQASSYLGDLDGDNIASENIYTEMRHQYYVWKNLLPDYDYVGFEHYRRVLFLDPWTDSRAPASYEEIIRLRGCFQQDGDCANIDLDAARFSVYWNMRANLDPAAAARLKHWISRHDVILPRPLFHKGMEQQWKTCQPVEAWDVMLEAVRQTRLARESRAVTDMRIVTASYNNMYIMRSDIFDEYMSFYFECIDYLIPRLSPGHRFWGHCAERLVNMYLYIKKVSDPLLQIHHQPYLSHLEGYVAALPNKAHNGS